MASPNISFETIPSSIRKPGKYFEFNTKLAVNTLSANKQRVLVTGQKTASGSVSKLVPTQIFSDVQAGEYFGQGSIVHLMCKSAIKANQYLDISAIALDDADTSVAATGSVALAGTATASGSAELNIGNEFIEVGIVKDDTAASIATALNAQIAKYTDIPVIASVATSTVTLTAKNKGTLGNQIPISCTVNAAGITATVTVMAGGSVDPDIADALAVVFAEHYQIIVTPYNNQTSLNVLSTHINSVSNSIEKRGTRGVYGMTGSLSEATTLAGQVNSGRLSSPYLRGTKSLSYELASAYAAVDAFEEDPAMPLNTLELTGINVPAISDRLTRNEQENLLYNGVTPIEVVNEKPQIVRAISTYTKNAKGTDDVSLLDITTIKTLDYVRDACNERVALRFPRAKLSGKTPKSVRSELLDVLYKLEELEILENVDAYKDKLICEKDSTDPDRVNTKIPADVVNGLHIIAGRIDLYL